MENKSSLVYEGLVSRVKMKIHKLAQEVQRQNKLIKVGHRSPAGWATVQEHLSDDLVSNSEDEKQIRTVETRALAKRKKVKQK